MANKKSVVILTTDSNNRFNIRVEPADHPHRDLNTWAGYHVNKQIRGHKPNPFTKLGVYLAQFPPGLTQTIIGEVDAEYSEACQLTRARRRTIHQSLKALGMRPMTA